MSKVELPDSPLGMYRMAALTATLFVVALISYVVYFEKSVDALVEAYQINLRGNFFTGFITIGSFMLSLKTFIVVKLKEGVYDSESYKAIFQKLSQSTGVTDLYAPLKKISHLLFGTILSSITTAVLHVTAGLVSHWSAILICIFAVVFSIVLLLVSLVLIKRNIMTWLES